MAAIASRVTMDSSSGPVLRLVGAVQVSTVDTCRKPATSRRHKLLNRPRGESDSCRCGLCRASKRQHFQALREWESLGRQNKPRGARPQLNTPHGQVLGGDGHWHCLLTERCGYTRSGTGVSGGGIYELAMPDAPHVCPCCRHGTAELAESERVAPRGPDRLCVHCRTDAAALAGLALQDELGIDLGWGKLFTEPDMRDGMHSVRRR